MATQTNQDALAKALRENLLKRKEKKRAAYQEKTEEGDSLISEEKDPSPYPQEEKA